MREKHSESLAMSHRQNGDKGSSSSSRGKQGRSRGGQARSNGSYIVSPTLCTKYTTTTATTNTQIQLQNAANRFMSMPVVFLPCRSFLIPPQKLSQEGAFALMLAHLHLTENTFNKRDLRNSCSSVKVRLGLLCLPVVLAVAMPQHCVYPTPSWGSWLHADDWA